MTPVPILIMETAAIASTMFTCIEGNELTRTVMLNPTMSNGEINEVIAEVQQVVPEGCLLPTLRISKN